MAKRLDEAELTKYWKDGDPEVQQGYLPNLRGPAGTKLRRESAETPALVIQWSSEAGQTTIRSIHEGSQRSAMGWRISVAARTPIATSIQKPRGSGIAGPMTSRCAM